LPDIADLKAVRRSAYIHSEGQRVDAFPACHLVRESSQTQQAARQWQTANSKLVPHRGALVVEKTAVPFLRALLQASPERALLSR
jgi:hypothetical protein